MKDDMIFQLWQDGICFSQRSGDNIKAEYHDMKVGSCRNLTDDIEIWRVK